MLKKTAETFEPQARAHKGVPPREAIISAGMKITGTIHSVTDVRIEGELEGDVLAATLTVAEGATVNGEVVAESVVVEGSVTGTVRTNNAYLASTGLVSGDVYFRDLTVDQGAKVNAVCECKENPISDFVAGSAAEEKLGKPERAASDVDTEDGTVAKIENNEKSVETSDEKKVATA